MAALPNFWRRHLHSSLLIPHSSLLLKDWKYDFLEIPVQFFRGLLHLISDPPLDHFDEATRDVVQEEVFRDFGGERMVFQEVVGDQRGKAGFEIAEEEIGAFGGEQVSHVVRIGLDVLQEMAEHRIRFAGGHVGITGVVVIHDAVDDVVKKFMAHFFQ